MPRQLRTGSGLLLFLIIALYGAGSTDAAVTLKGYWRMGENDAGAVPGGMTTSNVDLVASNNLVFSIPATYSSNVSLFAMVDTASSMALNIAGVSGTTVSLTNVATDDFGFECWINPSNASTGGSYPTLVSFNGIGIGQHNEQFFGFASNVGPSGGETTFFGYTSFAVGTWVHLAMVASGGSVTFYVNGVAAGSGGPQPTGAIAMTVGGGDYLIDELRLFNFAPGQFSRADLLLLQSNYVASPSVFQEGTAAGGDQFALTTYSPILPWTATANASWLHLAVTSGTGSSNLAFTFDANLAPNALARTGTISIADQTVTVTQPSPYSLSTNSVVEPMTAGTDSVNLTVNPGDPTWTAMADVSWIHLPVTNGSGSGAVAFSFDANPATFARTGIITIGGVVLTVTQAAVPIALGTTNLVEGSGAGIDSVILSMSSPYTAWAASTNAPWLRLGAGNQSGTGSTNVVFSFDANAGGTRTGTLTIAGQTLTVTQAGTNYIAAGVCQLLAAGRLSLYNLRAIAVDSAGNVYAGDAGDEGIQKWVAASNTVVTAMPEQDQIGGIVGMAVNDAGDIYLADYQNVYKWVAGNNALITTPAPGFDVIQSIALDSAGNVFISEYYGGPVYELTPDGTVTPVIPDGLFDGPTTVGVDAADNLYVYDSDYLLYEWGTTGSALTTLDDNWPYGYNANLTVDGSGNIYQVGYYSSVIDEWVAATQTQTTPVTGLQDPACTAMDGAGNLYIGGGYSQTVSEWPRAFVDASTKIEPAAIAASSRFFGSF